MQKMRLPVGISMTPAIVLACLAVFIAAIASTILLYDGAWNLFSILDSHRITIPQMVVALQSRGWHGELKKIHHVMSQSEPGCIAAESGDLCS